MELDPIKCGAVTITREYQEALAERLALGNNGGTWADHYTEDQKDKWRKMARDVVTDVSDHIEAIKS